MEKKEKKEKKIKKQQPVNRIFWIWKSVCVMVVILMLSGCSNQSESQPAKTDSLAKIKPIEGKDKTKAEPESGKEVEKEKDKEAEKEAEKEAGKEAEKEAMAAEDKLRRQEISLGNAEWQLQGELVEPAGEQALALLIMVHGSGPSDRDETIGPNRPFKQIADYLAEQGIASLRYDKRTFTYPAQIATQLDFTVQEEVVEDVVAAIEYAARLERVKYIFVLGHSAGGYLVPRIASASEIPTGYILANANVSSLGELIKRQIDFLTGGSEQLSGDQKQQVDKMLADADKTLAPDTIKPDEVVLGAYQAYWQDLKDYQPVEELKAMKQPILAIYSGMDYQVDDQEYQLFKRGLGQQANIEIQFFEGNNHLMMPSQGKGPQDYARPNQIDPAVLQAIVQFIKQNSR